MHRTRKRDRQWSHSPLHWGIRRPFIPRWSREEPSYESWKDETTVPPGLSSIPHSWGQDTEQSWVGYGLGSERASKIGSNAGGCLYLRVCVCVLV